MSSFSLAAAIARRQIVSNPLPVEHERPAAASPTAAKVRVKATSEQIGSCVRVRVIAGALPVKNVTGAILNRQELPVAEAFFDQNRCVIALLKGWTDAQLRSDQTKILTLRNLPDARGQLGSEVSIRGNFFSLMKSPGSQYSPTSKGFQRRPTWDSESIGPRPPISNPLRCVLATLLMAKSLPSLRRQVPLHGKRIQQCLSSRVHSPFRQMVWAS